MTAAIPEMTVPLAVRGWQAELELGFVGGATRTTLAHRHHLGPLRVQRPFYPDGPVCNVYVVHPPGGVVGGDRLDLRFNASAGAHALLTTPAAGKFYRSAGPEARQKIDIRLNAAALEWLPQETIYYPGAVVRQQTVIRLDAASRYIGWDLGAYGLAARGERFDSGVSHQGLELWRDDRPLLIDRLRLAGGGGAFKAAWGLADLPVLGTFVACPASSADVDAARESVASHDDVTIGISLVDGVLIGRVLARQTDAAMRSLVHLWQTLRPRLMQRDAVLPRIWAT
ncbi:MAG: urease accessory protein UreD [Nevskia sp.]|nr:urease accessory protein UreD [Nevskia sp.]